MYPKLPLKILLEVPLWLVEVPIIVVFTNSQKLLLKHITLVVTGHW